MLRACLLLVAVLIGACGDPAVKASDARLVEITDGDTLTVETDGDLAVVRLVGVNTPERDECHFGEATTALRRLVEGGNLRLERVGPDDRDRFGRVLGYVYSGDVLVNLELVALGHGVAPATSHPRSDEFARAAESAWRERLGMWAGNACGSSSERLPRIAISAVEANPPGDDALRPNDEFVVLRNDGDGDVSLQGWRIRDASSTNRFVFPAAAVLAAGTAVTVHSGCGTDSRSDLYWCAGPVWSNDGDTVVVQAPDGTVVDRFAYRRDQDGVTIAPPTSSSP